MINEKPQKMFNENGDQLEAIENRSPKFPGEQPRTREMSNSLANETPLGRMTSAAFARPLRPSSRQIASG